MVLIQEVSNPVELSTSVSMLSSFIQAAKKGQPVPTTGFELVDVRDVARAHILVGESEDPQVSNQRFIVSHSAVSFAEFVRRVIEAFPDDFKGVELTTIGDEETGKQQTVYFDNTKLLKTIPSFKLTDVSESVVEFYSGLKKLNLI
jgi:nucleoside-diphosphate-sugar epimerase